MTDEGTYPIHATPPGSADVAAFRPTQTRFVVLAAICGLSLLTYLDRVCIMRASPDIQAELVLDDEQMGLVFSAFLVGYALLEVPGGWLGDRWGTRRVLTVIVVWWSAFTALTGFVPGSAPQAFAWAAPLLAHGFLLMLLVRFLFGAGEAGAYPNLARVVGAWFPYGERAFAQGGIWMSARLGGAVAPWIFGRLMSGVGWRGAFWVLGLVGLAWAVWFRWWFRDTPEEQVTCNLAERQLIRAGPYSWKAVEASAGHRRPPWGRLARSVSLWALCLAAAGVSFGWYFYPTWQPRFLQDRFGIDFGDSELLTGLPFLCGAAGSVLGGSLSDRLVRATGSRRWGRSALGLVGFLGAGLCVLATGWALAAWQAVTLLCLAFFLSDLALPSLWAATTDIGGRYAGTVAGVMNSAGGLGSILSPSLTPRLRTLQFAWPAIFAILALGWLVAGLAWLFIDAGQSISAQEAKGAK